MPYFFVWMMESDFETLEIDSFAWVKHGVTWKNCARIIYRWTYFYLFSSKLRLRELKSRLLLGAWSLVNEPIFHMTFTFDILYMMINTIPSHQISGRSTSHKKDSGISCPPEYSQIQHIKNWIIWTIISGMWTILLKNSRIWAIRSSRGTNKKL